MSWALHWVTMIASLFFRSRFFFRRPAGFEHVIQSGNDRDHKRCDDKSPSKPEPPLSHEVAEWQQQHKDRSCLEYCFIFSAPSRRQHAGPQHYHPHEPDPPLAKQDEDSDPPPYFAEQRHGNPCRTRE